jgi:peptidoglycan/xylan/chitin deacetylase (PgdA/CDA1 family)
LRPGLRRRRAVVYRGRRRRRAIALTFDDGPSEWTPALLDVLRHHRARATFFVLGGAVVGHEETLHRAVREGHELGNHLNEHRDPSQLTDEELVEELEQASRALEAVVGAPRLVRPPYGHDARRVSRVAASIGLGPVVLGTVDPSDWQVSEPEIIVSRVLADAAPGAIVFLHDGVPAGDTTATKSRAPTVQAVAELLPALAGRGYEIVTVSELLQ